MEERSRAHEITSIFVFCFAIWKHARMVVLGGCDSFESDSGSVLERDPAGSVVLHVAPVGLVARVVGQLAFLLLLLFGLPLQRRRSVPQAGVQHVVHGVGVQRLRYAAFQTIAVEPSNLDKTLALPIPKRFQGHGGPRLRFSELATALRNVIFKT